MSEKLLPCPFCGKSVYSELRKIWGYDRHQIFCACGCHSPNFGRGEELTAWWNTRPSLPVSEPGVRGALTDADWLKAWTKRTGHTMKPGPKRDAMLADARWAASVALAPPSPSPAPSQENDRG